MIGKTATNKRVIFALAVTLVLAAAIALNIRSMRWIPEADAKVAAARLRQANAELDSLRARADSSPGDYAAQRDCARALAERDDLFTATIYAERAAALNPSLAEAHLLLGLIYAPLDYSQRAESAYRKAIALDPSLLEAYQRLADLLRARGHLPEAEGILQKAIARSPDAPGPRLSMAAIQLDKSRHHEVVKTLEPVLESGSPPVAALYLAGKAWQASGQTKRAADSLRAAVASAPDFADARHALGSILANEGKFSEALVELRKAVELDPRNPSYRYALANALRSDRSSPDNISLARVEFESAIELNPRDPFAHYYYGNILEEQSLSDAAIREYERTLEIEPTFSSARHRLGSLLKSLGRTEEGERHLERFASEARRSITEVHGGRRDNSFLDTADSHVERGIRYLKEGKGNLARKSFQLALEREPHHPEAARNLRKLDGGPK
jgi:tetratricopeptide (TPR) repeat protein